MVQTLLVSVIARVTTFLSIPKNLVFIALILKSEQLVVKQKLFRAVVLMDYALYYATDSLLPLWRFLNFLLDIYTV